MGMEQGGYTEEGNGGADFTYGYGGGGDEFALDYATYYGGAGDDFYYGYGAGESGEYGGPIDYAPLPDLPFYQGPSFEDIPLSPQPDIPLLPYDPIELFAETIRIGTEEPQTLPELSFPFYGLPYVPDPFLTPYTPTFPEYGLPPPPNEPRLPGYCPSGYYHPIDDPYTCVPFPEATTNQQQQQKPPAQQHPAPAPAKPPVQQQQQQACPTGYCKHPQTGQCIPIPQGYMRHPQTQVCTLAQQQSQQQQCPAGYCKHPVTGQCMPIPNGYYRHSQTQVCTALTPQASPLPIPSEVGDLWSNLKNLPWWVWLALGGVFLLSQGGEERKTTTVRYQKAK